MPRLSKFDGNREGGSEKGSLEFTTIFYIPLNRLLLGPDREILMGQGSKNVLVLYLY